MDSNLLKIFIEVANKKSISLAANALGYAQPNVTARIKQLEKTLDVKLFHRIPTGVALTEQGKLFYTDALEIIYKLEKSILALKSNPQKSLRIGSTECNALLRISSFLLQLHQDFPSLQLELFTGTTKKVIEQLLDYQIDIGFISGIPNDDRLMIIQSIEEDIALIEPNIVNVPNISLSYKEGCIYDDFFKNYNKQNGIQIDSNLAVGNIETILACVKVGMGKSILPISLIEKFGYIEDTTITIKTLDKQTAFFPTCLVCRKDHTLTQLFEYLENMPFA